MDESNIVVATFVVVDSKRREQLHRLREDVWVL